MVIYSDKLYSAGGAGGAGGVERVLVYGGMVFLHEEFEDKVSRHVQGKRIERYRGTYFPKTPGRCLPAILLRCRQVEWGLGDFKWTGSMDLRTGYWFLSVCTRIHRTYTAHTLDLGYHGPNFMIHKATGGEIPESKFSEMPPELDILVGDPEEDEFNPIFDRLLVQTAAYNGEAVSPVSVLLRHEEPIPVGRQAFAPQI
jgi:hypothetical protein